jgi:hypothetical protein
MKQSHPILSSASGLVVFLLPGCGLLLGLDGYSLATCEDGVQSGDEAGVDCGGPCAPCDPAGTCADGARSRDETDIDCGGPCAVKCSVGQGCFVGPDCLSRVCIGGTCVPPACDDEVMNGEETSLDCGGVCPSSCGEGEGCEAGTDCESRICEGEACAPNYAWSLAFGTSGMTFTRAAADLAGGVVLAASYSGSIDLGGGPLTSAGGSDVLLAKLDAGGKRVWSKSYGDAAQQQVVGVATDADGDILVTGAFSGELDFGDGALTSAGGEDIFLAKLDKAGSPVWSKRFGDDKPQRPVSVAFDGEGNVLLAGQLEGSADFGGGQLSSAGGADAFVAKFDPNGTHLFSRRFGDSGAQTANAVVSDSAGVITVTGSFSGSIDFGGGLLSTGVNTTDVFIAQFTREGTPLWSDSFGDTFDNEAGVFVGVDGEGDLLVTGVFDGSLDLGTGETFKSAGGLDLFFLRISGSGAPVWSKALGTELSDTFFGYALSTDGSLTLAGSFQGALDVGAGPMTSPENEDFVIARWSPSGEHIWSRRYGSALQSGLLFGLASDGGGDVFLTGSFSEQLDLGGGPLMADSQGDIFLAKLRVP